MMMMMKVTFFYSKELCHTTILSPLAVVVVIKMIKMILKKGVLQQQT